MTIIDRRKNSKGKSTANRKKFVDRYKRQLKREVEDLAKDRSIQDIFNEGEVTISGDDISEPTFEHNHNTGNRDFVLPGNKKYRRGDHIKKDQSGEGSGRGGSNDGDGEDDFKFVLTKEEFLDLYFSGMALPDFIKESAKNNVKFKYKKAGFSKEGIPARLNVKKTMEQAYARRIATKSQGKKPRFLDDEDIRYDYFAKKPEPVRTAVMFCLMDCSGSMEEFHKTIAKKFFLLLYLFLHKEYEFVELVFIRHTHTAAEVDEDTFFNSRVTGGTIVSTALELAYEIMTERYDASATNFYISQASDGDNWADDMKPTEELLRKIVPMVQYYAYIEINDPHWVEQRRMYGQDQLLRCFKNLEREFKNLKCREVVDASEVYPVLQELFQK